MSDITLGLDTNTMIRLLREARATLEAWKDVAPAVTLCADIDRALALYDESLKQHQERFPIPEFLRRFP